MYVYINIVYYTIQLIILKSDNVLVLFIYNYLFVYLSIVDQYWIKKLLQYILILIINSRKIFIYSWYVI